MSFSDEIPMMLERKNGEPEFVNKLSVGFGLLPLQDPRESRKAGRPIFKDVVHVQIMVPGDSKSLILRPAVKKDHEDYPMAYAKFKSNEAIAQQGTPIELWAQITRGEALSLKSAGIRTVEELAEVHDGNLGKLGASAREFRTKARAFVNTAANTAAAAEMAMRNHELEQKNASLEERYKQLAAQVSGLLAAQAAGGQDGEAPARRGRRPAAEQPAA